MFGTLVPKWPTRQTEQVHRRMAEFLGVGEMAFAEAWRESACGWEVGRITLRELLGGVRLKVGLRVHAENVNQLESLWVDLVQGCLRPRDQAVLDTLQWCRGNGITVGLLGNAGPDVPPVFRGHRLATMVNDAVFSCEVGTVKPDPEIYKILTSRLHVETSDCVYLGDGGSRKLEGALGVGMKPVLLRIPTEIEAEGPTAVVPDWRGAVIESFGAIKHYLRGE